MKKINEELSKRGSGAEVEVGKAAMMIAPLVGDSTDGVKENGKARSVTQSALSQAMRIIEVFSDSVMEIRRGIRKHPVDFTEGVDADEMKQMSLGLAHTSSRFKPK